VGGTLIWYYYICQRQVWMMAHQVNPDEDDPNLQYGRFLHAHTYPRERHEILLGHNKLDLMTDKNGQAVVVEIKKSSRYLKSATMQLAHYLSGLEEQGIHARGEIRIPEERRREPVILDQAMRDELARVRRHIQALVHGAIPRAERSNWCRKCAYAELCWA